jgi:hypothetical protein
VAAKRFTQGDPRVLSIGFAWTGDSSDPGGYCPEQFSVTATETSSSVRVSDVARVVSGAGACAGVGIVNGTGWATLRLKAPLGNREVIRASDGAVLPLGSG